MIELAVPDMSCGHCRATVTAAIRASQPGAGVEIDTDARRVRVSGAEDAAALVAALAAAGYPASVAAKG
ncbi:MAG: heavy-metal-associated domain-containing protein [Rhodobacteraceae bacterium]|jgi:copper chaperone|nr:heavy-metal-associated domain-containing protein [Paracoccaceae bacterium]